MGRYWGGGCLGAVIKGCVVCGIQLGWRCVVSGSSEVSSGFLFSVGDFWSQVSIACVCVCVCVLCVW